MVKIKDIKGSKPKKRDWRTDRYDLFNSALQEYGECEIEWNKENFMAWLDEYIDDGRTINLPNLSDILTIKEGE